MVLSESLIFLNDRKGSLKKVPLASKFPKGDFYLMDERNPDKKGLIRVDSESALEHLESGTSTRQKRDMMYQFGQFEERVKLFALEGSTLTFMGMVNYDAQKDEFVMTDALTFAAGGVQDVSHYLRGRLGDVTEGARACLTLASFCFFAAGAITYFWFKERN